MHGKGYDCYGAAVKGPGMKSELAMRMTLAVRILFLSCRLAPASVKALGELSELHEIIFRVLQPIPSLHIFLMFDASPFQAHLFF